MLGLEFDSETERERVIRAGAAPDLAPFVRVRGTRMLTDQDRAQVQESSAVLAGCRREPVGVANDAPRIRGSPHRRVTGWR